jgi:hypothetical protein
LNAEVLDVTGCLESGREVWIFRFQARDRHLLAGRKVNVGEVWFCRFSNRPVHYRRFNSHNRLDGYIEAKHHRL